MTLAFKRKNNNDEMTSLKIIYVLHLSIFHVCGKFGKDRPNIKKVMPMFRIARHAF